MNNADQVPLSGERFPAHRHHLGPLTMAELAAQQAQIAFATYGHVKVIDNPIPHDRIGHVKVDKDSLKKLARIAGGDLDYYPTIR